MRSFLFNLGVPGPGESAITTVRLYESADVLTGWGLVNSVAVGSLIDDPSGKKRWDNAIANPANYARLAPVSAAGIERPGGVILPPASVDTDAWTLYCYAVDIGLDIQAGIPLRVSPKRAARSGQRVVITNKEVLTDVTGYAAITIPADVGVIVIAIKSIRVEKDTAGLAGQIISLADLL